jgi:hypothetical protein
MLGGVGRRGPLSGILCQHPIHLEEVGPSFSGVVKLDDLKVNLMVFEGKVGQDDLWQLKLVPVVLGDH